MSLAVYSIDSGLDILLARAGGDSLRGRAWGTGMQRDSAVRRAVAKRRAPCYHRIPIGVASLTPEEGLRRGQLFPQGRPSWIDADSLSLSDSQGRRYIRHVALVTFRANVQSTPVIYTFQALGGIAIGMMPSASTDRPNSSATYIVWLEDGATLADIERVIARVANSNEVLSIAPYLTARFN